MVTSEGSHGPAHGRRTGDLLRLEEDGRGTPSSQDCPRTADCLSVPTAPLVRFVPDQL